MGLESNYKLRLDRRSPRDRVAEIMPLKVT